MTVPPSSESDLQADLSGRRLGDYQVLRRLGQGGMAVVYLARQESLRRQVALKVLKPQLAEDLQYLRRFQNEAQAAAALVHANIVQIHEVGCIDGLQFIAQEYVAGQNLKQLLDRQVTVDVSQATSILRQVAAALRKAGQHGIVHRDIKPENILIDGDGIVKVADFGLARQNARQDGMELTQVGVTMGTPLYMSPEQVEGRQLDSRTDIYSLGVTSYQMLAGHPPFQGDTPLSLALAHVKQVPTPLQHSRSDLPDRLCTIIHRMLAKLPQDRYSDAGQLLRDLEALPIAGGRSDEDFTPLSAEMRSGASPQPVFAETQALASVLHAQQHPWRGRRARTGLTLAVMALFGAVLAGATRSPDPLAIQSEAASLVPRKETAEEQFYFASLLNTEAAWKSVAEYFPLSETDKEKQRLTVLRSKQQLARWYLLHERAREALPLLEELVELDNMQNDLRAVGLAGQAIAYKQLGEYDEAANVLSSAMSLAEFLDRPILMELESLERELRDKLK